MAFLDCFEALDKSQIFDNAQSCLFIFPESIIYLDVRLLLVAIMHDEHDPPPLAVDIHPSLGINA